MTSVPKLNARTPFLQDIPNSLISKEWYRALNSIAVILGSGQDISDLGTFQELVYSTPKGVDLSDQLNEIRNIQNLIRSVTVINQQLQDRISILESQLINQNNAINTSYKLSLRLDNIDSNLLRTSQPIPIPPLSSGGSVATTTSTNTTPYGYSTAAQANAIVTLVNNIRTALINNNIMT